MVITTSYGHGDYSGMQKRESPRSFHSVAVGRDTRLEGVVVFAKRKRPGLRTVGFALFICFVGGFPEGSDTVPVCRPVVQY